MEENFEQKVDEGNGVVKISEDVVAIIASTAVGSVDGVYSMSGSIAGGIGEFLGVKKGSSRGIKVDMDGQNVSVDVHISVLHGKKIPDLAWEIQEKVKASVEDITGLVVDKVNVHIDGISFEKPKKEAEANDTDDSPADEDKTE